MILEAVVIAAYIAAASSCGPEFTPFANTCVVPEALWRAGLEAVSNRRVVVEKVNSDERWEQLLPSDVLFRGRDLRIPTNVRLRLRCAGSRALSPIGPVKISCRCSAAHLCERIIEPSGWDPTAVASYACTDCAVAVPSAWKRPSAQTPWFPTLDGRAAVLRAGTSYTLRCRGQRSLSGRFLPGRRGAQSTLSVTGACGLELSGGGGDRRLQASELASLRCGQACSTVNIASLVDRGGADVMVERPADANGVTPGREMVLRDGDLPEGTQLRLDCIGPNRFLYDDTQSNRPMSTITTTCECNDDGESCSFPAISFQSCKTRLELSLNVNAANKNRGTVSARSLLVVWEGDTVQLSCQGDSVRPSSVSSVLVDPSRRDRLRVASADLTLVCLPHGGSNDRCQLEDASGQSWTVAEAQSVTCEEKCRLGSSSFGTLAGLKEAAAVVKRDLPGDLICDAGYECAKGEGRCRVRCGDDDTVLLADSGTTAFCESARCVLSTDRRMEEVGKIIEENGEMLVFNTSSFVRVDYKNYGVQPGAEVQLKIKCPSGQGFRDPASKAVLSDHATRKGTCKGPGTFSIDYDPRTGFPVCETKLQLYVDDSAQIKLGGDVLQSPELLPSDKKITIECMDDGKRLLFNVGKNSAKLSLDCSGGGSQSCALKERVESGPSGPDISGKLKCESVCSFSKLKENLEQRAKKLSSVEPADTDASQERAELVFEGQAVKLTCKENFTDPGRTSRNIDLICDTDSPSFENFDKCVFKTPRVDRCPQPVPDNAAVTTFPMSAKAGTTLDYGYDLTLECSSFTRKVRVVGLERELGPSLKVTSQWDEEKEECFLDFAGSTENVLSFAGFTCGGFCKLGDFRTQDNGLLKLTLQTGQRWEARGEATPLGNIQEVDANGLAEEGDEVTLSCDSGRFFREVSSPHLLFPLPRCTCKQNVCGFDSRLLSTDSCRDFATITMPTNDLGSPKFTKREFAEETKNGKSILVADGGSVEVSCFGGRKLFLSNGREKELQEKKKLTLTAYCPDSTCELGSGSLSLTEEEASELECLRECKVPEEVDSSEEVVLEGEEPRLDCGSAGRFCDGEERECQAVCKDGKLLLQRDDTPFACAFAIKMEDLRLNTETTNLVDENDKSITGPLKEGVKFKAQCIGQSTINPINRIDPSKPDQESVLAWYECDPAGSNCQIYLEARSTISIAATIPDLKNPESIRSYLNCVEYCSGTIEDYQGKGSLKSGPSEPLGSVRGVPVLLDGTTFSIVCNTTDSTE